MEPAHRVADWATTSAIETLEPKTHVATTTADETHEAAQDAFVAISTLSRDVPLEKVEELVATVLRDHETAVHLPELIFHMRNHTKSLAPGEGLGERTVSCRLLVALSNCDPTAAIALLKLVPLYGSWKSLVELLELTDAVGVSRQGETYHPSSAHQHSALQAAVHDMFASQLRTDEASVKEGGGVSNASKFVPHEKRGARFMSHHGDQIAERLFGARNTETGLERTPSEQVAQAAVVSRTRRGPRCSRSTATSKKPSTSSLQVRPLRRRPRRAARVEVASSTAASSGSFARP